MRPDLNRAMDWGIDNPMIIVTGAIVIVLISGFKHWFIFWLGQQKERNK
tara:strand:+ start:9713 stop:9859 length:147 start_codon:yes stop_codon:yes gene_type:complete